MWLLNLRALTPATQERRRADFYKTVLHHEARLGGELFGPIPKKHRREFFCLDEHTWVWHEEWNDEQKQRHIVTTRYDIRPSGILKSQGGRHYQALTPVEAQNLTAAMRLYVAKMSIELPKLAVAV